MYGIKLIVAEGARLVRKCKKRIFSCGAFSGTIIQCPAGAAGQVRPRNRFSDEEYEMRKRLDQPRQALEGLKEKSLFDFT
jgi:hypothetical protein